MIYCYDVQGNLVPVATELVQFRPAAYGILIDEYQQVLLIRQPDNELFLPPGGILSTQNTPKQAIRFHFRRATGITPHVGELLLVEDQYRIFKDLDAWHLSVMYYDLRKPTLTTNTLGESDKLSVEAHWVPVAELDRSQLMMGWDAIQASQLKQKLQAAQKSTS